MAKTWGELSQLPDFQSMSREEQEKVRNLYFDQEVAPRVAPEMLSKARSMFDERTLNRTWGEAFSDTGKQLVEGGINIATAIPALIAPGSDFVKAGNTEAEAWRESQSPTMKAKSAAAERAVEEAGKEGFWAQTKEAASQYGTDPALASRLVATNLASLIPGLGSAKAAQMASMARAGRAAKTAGVALDTTEAAQRAAKMAMIAGGTTNSALNAGGARGEAYQDIYKTLMDTGDYSQEQAHQIASDQSRLPAAVGAITGAASMLGLERALLGPAMKGGAASRFTKSLLAEQGTEMLEEGAPKVATNWQAGEYDQRPLIQDLGTTLVQTAIGAGPSSLAAGAGSAMRAPEGATPTPAEAPPGTTLPDNVNLDAMPPEMQDQVAQNLAEGKAWDDGLTAPGEGIETAPAKPTFAGLPQEQQQQALQNIAEGRPWDEGLAITDAEIGPTGAPISPTGAPISPQAPAVSPPAPAIPVVGPLSAAANAGQQAEAVGVPTMPQPSPEELAQQQADDAQAAQQQATSQAQQQVKDAAQQTKLQTDQFKLQQQQQAAAVQQAEQPRAAAQQAYQTALKNHQQQVSINAAEKKAGVPITQFDETALLEASKALAALNPKPTIDQETTDGLQTQTDAQVPGQAPDAANAPAGAVGLATTQAPAPATGQTSAPGTAPVAAPAQPATATAAPPDAPLSNAPAPTEEQFHVDAFNRASQRLNATGKESAPRALVRLATAQDLPAAGRVARRLASAVAATFGHRVIYIASADNKTTLSFDGSVSPNDPTQILIANDAEAPITRVVAHEVLHGLKRVAPDIYDNMLGGLRQVYDPQQVARHTEQRGYQGGLNESNEEEWVADFFSNTLHDPQSLAKLALAMDLKKTGSGLEFLNNLKEFIGRILAKLRGDPVIGQGFEGADAAVKDLEQARETVVKAIAQYARARLTGKTAETLAAAPLSVRKAQVETTTQVDEGITDDMDALEDAPEPEMVDTTKPQARKTGKSTENKQWLMSDGTYHGGPEWVNNPTQLGKLRSTLFTLAQEGERGKYWYEKSSKAILAMAGGDPNVPRNEQPKEVLDRAEVLVKLLAIYSPNSKVPGNTTAALKAYYQWLSGAEQVHAGLGQLDDKANEMLNHGTEWEGIKTNNFYYNLMVEIDPTRNVKDAATMDMWMALAFDYGSKQVKAIAYPFMHKETLLIAKRLTKETGTPWTPHQAQAAIWTAIKARIDAIRGDLARISVEQGWHDPEKVKRNKGKPQAITIANAHRRDYYHKAYELGMAKAFDANDVNIASYDFSNAINERLVQMSIEAVPGASTDILPGIHKAPMAEKLEYQAAIIKVMRDNEGRDRIYKHLGILDLERRLGFSGWEGKGTPGFQDSLAAAVVGGEVSDEAKLALNLAADIRGLVLAQEGVAWHYPHYTGKGGSLNGIELDLGRNLTAEENDAFYSALIEELGHNMAPPIPRVDGRGVRILNFPDEKFALMDDFSDGPDLLGNTGAQRKKSLLAAQLKKNNDFHKAVADAVSRQPWRKEVAQRYKFQSDGELRENNWNPEPVERDPNDLLQDTSRRSNDADYRDRIFEMVSRRVGNRWARSPDLQKRLTDELDKTTKFIDGLRKDIHAVNADFAKRKGWGGPQTFIPFSLRPNAARDERVGTGAETQGRPSYGRARPGAVKSTGVHYSRATRETLDSSKYGTGIQGEEARRVANADDKRLRHRIYFYVSSGKGVTPEPGVGGYAHTVDLNNLYDLDADPQYLVPKDVSLLEDVMNGFESAVIDAGFDGYVADFAGQRAAVLLGPQQVPVQYEGLAVRPQVPAGERAPTNPIKRIGALLRTPWVKQTPKAFGDRLKAADPELYRPFADQFTATDKTYWPGEMTRQLRDPQAPPRLVFSNRATVREENLAKREFGAVVRSFTNSDGSKKDGWLKAPNGRPSNLDNRQWVQVRTPSFIKWFGPWLEYAERPGGVWNDEAGKVSKVVDENGEPMVVYHGSQKAGFTVLDPAKGDQHRSAMVFTAKTSETAATYAGTKDEAEMPAALASDEGPTQASFEALGYEFGREEDEDRGTWWTVTDPEGNLIDSDNYDSLEEAVALAAEDYDKWGDAYNAVEEKPGIYALFLNIRDPYESDFGGANWDGQQLGEWFSIWDSENQEYVEVNDAVLLTEGDAERLYEELGGDEVEYDGRPRYEIQEAPELGETTNSVAEEALRFGNDGAMIHDVVDDGGHGGYYQAEPDTVMVFFNANQAKSATQNTGEFSTSNDDLRFSLRTRLTLTKPQVDYQKAANPAGSDADRERVKTRLEEALVATGQAIPAKFSVLSESGPHFGVSLQKVGDDVSTTKAGLNNELSRGRGGSALYGQYAYPIYETEAATLQRRNFRPFFADGGWWIDAIATLNGAYAGSGSLKGANPEARTDLRRIDRRTPDVWAFEHLPFPKTENDYPTKNRQKTLKFSNRQTQTPAFKKWFGNSKITDADGQPKVMYHGTAENIESFKPRQANAIFLTDNPDFASGFAGAREGANVLPVYVASANPFDYRDPQHITRLEAVLRQNHGTAPIEVAMPRVPVMRLSAEDLAKRTATGNWMFIESPPVMAYIKANHDGFWTKERNQVNLGVFKPTQIKSAIGNRGTFDPANPDIRFSNRPTPEGQPAPPAETRRRKIQRIVQDKFNRWQVIQDWLKEHGVNLSDTADVVKAEERFHSRVANQIEDFRRDVLKPLQEKTHKAGFTNADIAQFLHAQMAEKRNIDVAAKNPRFPDGGSGMDTQEARTILAAAPPELKKIANEWRQITEDSLDMKVASGLITPEMAKAFRLANPDYAPVRGGPEDQRLVGSGKGYKVRHKEQRALGHPVRPGGEWIIENILADRESTIMKAEKALLAKHVLQMAVEMQRPDLISVNEPQKRQVLKNNVSYLVTYRGSPVEAFTTLEAARVFRQMAGTQKGNKVLDFDIVRSSSPEVTLMASPMLADNELMAYVAGHEIRMQLNDDLLARAYGNLGAEGLGAVLQAGRTLNTWLSKVYTGYNPEFIFVNVIRDFITGLANLTGEQGATMALRAAQRYPKAFKDLLKYAINPEKATQSIKDYREDGGNTGAAYLDDMERIGGNLANEYAKLQGVVKNLRERNVRGAAAAGIARPIQFLVAWIEKLNIAGENAMRLAIYQAMRDSGKGRAAAASAAKNTTVNFNRKGELGLQMNAMWLFFNAAVQGTSAIAHSHFKGANKGQAWAFSGSVIGLSYLASLLAAGDDEEDDKYESVGEYERSRNLLIRTENGFAKIPVPYGYGFFHNLGRALADLQRTGEMGKLPWHLASGFIEEFTPFGSMVAGKGPDSQQALTFMGPTAWQIFAVPALNRTSFGTPLYPEKPWQKAEFARDQYWRGTGGTWADTLAGALEQTGIDVSPESLKHLWRTATGGAGTAVTDTYSMVALGAQGAATEPKETPFLRKLYTVPGVQDARARYYGSLEEARIAKETLKRFKDKGAFEEAETYQGKNAAMIAMADVGAKLAKRIEKRRDAYDAVRKDETLPIAEKRRQLREMEVEEIQIYDDYVRLFQERTRKAP